MSTHKNNEDGIAYTFDLNGALSVDAASLLQSPWFRKQLEAVEQIVITERTQQQKSTAQSD